MTWKCDTINAIWSAVSLPCSFEYTYTTYTWRTNIPSALMIYLGYDFWFCWFTNPVSVITFNLIFIYIILLFFTSYICRLLIFQMLSPLVIIELIVYILKGFWIFEFVFQLLTHVLSLHIVYVNCICYMRFLWYLYSLVDPSSEHINI